MKKEYKYTQKQAEDILMYHKYLYYEKADPMISDYEYDQLELKFKKEFPNSALIQDSIECPRELWPEFEKRYKKI